MFRPSVERWREDVKRIAPSLPSALVLAVIQRESGGVPGLPGSANDNGLMQCKPSVVKDYQRAHPDTQITHADMSRTDLKGARRQIAVGSWLIGHQLRVVNKQSPALAPWPNGSLTEFQVRMADLRYARGGGAVNKLSKRARAAGYPVTPDGLMNYRNKFEPKWGTPGSPFKHGLAIYRMYATNNGQPGPPGRRRSPRRPSTEKSGAGLMVIAVLAFIAAKYR